MTEDVEIEVCAEPEYKILYNLPADIHTVICVGGRGGKKTYEVSKFIAFSVTALQKRAVIVRDEQTRIKETILNEIWERYKTANEDGLLDLNYIRNQNELIDRETKDTLLYTKGFRASTSDNKAALKGDSGIDLAIIEEAEDIRDVDKYNTFVDSLRKEGCVVIIMLNTPDLQHWLVKRWFNTRATSHDGYYEIYPKDIPGLLCIQTSYLDNPYLPAHIVANYEGYGDSQSHLYNLHYFLTGIKGYASTGRKGQVFTKVKPIKLVDYFTINSVEIYGQDFGTASPAALVGVKFVGNKCYVRLISYKPNPVLELGKLYSTLRFGPTDKIVCDYAEPISISKLANGWRDLEPDMYFKYPELSRGFYVVPCPSKDIEARIGLMASLELHAVEEHAELWEEINNFVYAQDKYGNYTDTPVDDFNHAFFDAAGYVCVSERGQNQMRAY